MRKNRDTSLSKNCAYCGTVFYRDKRCTWAHWGRAKYCTRSCSSKSWAQNTHKVYGSVEDRFWSNVDKKAIDDCWIWTGSANSSGYGVLSVKGKKKNATHISLELHGEAVPKGLFALHKCDNPRCVNPNHLYIGSVKENARDAVIRNRFKKKLTPEKALEIAGSSKTAHDLAEEYGVTTGLVYHIRSGRKWSYVTGIKCDD